MASISAIAIDDALTTRTKKEPSGRTLRTQALEKDADAVIAAVKARGAAKIDFSQEEGDPDRYLSGLRAALTRKGQHTILLQKKRGMTQAVAWQMREEDKDRVAKRRETGTRLGQHAKARARTRRSRT